MFYYWFVLSALLNPYIHTIVREGVTISHSLHLLFMLCARDKPSTSKLRSRNLEEKEQWVNHNLAWRIISAENLLSFNKRTEETNVTCIWKENGAGRVDHEAVS